jgi:hypothetical protein
MIIPFDKIPKESRVWIYQSNRKFTEKEITEITNKLKNFLENWTAHGFDLLCSFTIKYNRFIIIALNEKSNKATGCSIDSCVHFIQELEHQYSIDLLDKMNVAFKQGEFISYKSLIEFKKLVKSNSVSKNTIVFNNLVTDVLDFNTNWEIPAYKSWHSRFFL